MDADSAIDAHRLERRGIRLSLFGALFMAALGFGFAVVTDSRAVLLDGFYSLINFAVGLVAMRVATLVRQPGDERFHFGYASFEPMLNLMKGLLVAFIGLLAGWASVEALFSGGRRIDGTAAVAYAVIAAVGCFAIAIVLRRISRRCSSPILEVDTRNWLVDGLLSVGVAVAFLVSVSLEGTRLAKWTPYADPAVVLVLALAAMPLPLNVIRSNWGQLLGRAPRPDVQRQVHEAVDRALAAGDGMRRQVRILEQGRFTYVQIYVVLEADAPDPGLAEVDRMRAAVEAEFASLGAGVGFDLLFTADERWLRATLGIPVDQEAR